MFRITGFCLFFILSAAAAQQHALTLEDAVGIALEKSYQIKSARLNQLSAEKNLISAKSRFRLQIDMDIDMPAWNERVQAIQVPNGLPQYNTTGEMRYETNLEIRQPLPTNGYLSLNGQGYHQDVSFWSDQLQRDLHRKEFYSSLSARFNQPLFTLNAIKTNFEQADLRYENSTERYKREEAEIVYQVTWSFYNVYSAMRQLEIAKADVKQQKELYTLAQQKYDAGLIPEVEALQMEVNYSEAQNNLVAAEAAIDRLKDSFKQLIGLKLSDDITVMTELEIDSIRVDTDQAIGLALENRAEIREAEIDVELQKLNVKEVDAMRDFQGNLFAFYEIVGVSDPATVTSNQPYDLYKASLTDMTRRPNNRGVVFNVSIPIFDWGGNKAAVQSAEAELRNSELALAEEKKTIEREVRDVVRTLRESKSQLKVNRKRQEVAERAFSITMQRFNNGDITTQELALDRESYISAQLAYLNAYIDYQMALADLKRKTMWDFADNTSLVE